MIQNEVMNMFKIGDFAKLNKVSIKALHHYDELGLLPPMKIDEQTGYRYYAASQIPRLHRIMAFKAFDFSLQEIAQISGEDTSAVAMVTILQQKKAELQAELASRQEKLNRLTHLIHHLQKEEDVHMLQYDVVIKKEEAKMVMSIREHVADYTNQGLLWNELISHLSSHRAKISSPIAIYYDASNEECGPNIEVAVPVHETIPETNRIACRELESVNELACVIHKGDTDTLTNAYTALQLWMEQNDYTLAGPVREVHHEGYLTTADTSQHVTEIQIPVKKER
ncbi:MerR family transcriptional regulator [Brevibacillus fluminis]|uniref:MerR family transcriptional regulator n=1 Tax=Brevibacillus fluminis TaxID=511487 RepID=A0A3M8DUY3_9BACL|nr:MerR family transcriptional regulator [Brevibacillus fluminis]RNB91978.1 MerR family transcriptional regulator [Brevibacillus fluminis]